MTDPKMVLLVEDSMPVAIASRHLLKNAGYSMTHAKCGEEALTLCTNNTYEFILMDIGLGEGNMDGVETTRKIRALDISQYPIFAVTSHVQEKDREAYLAAGMNDVAEKPLMPEKLKEMLANL